jgi:hypothetical protein
LNEVPSSLWDFFNENLVNIDVMPLGAFNSEEGGDEGDDVEEIEDGVFDSSQPTQRNRTMNYTKVEDACLAKAWKSVSLDVVSGNDRTKKRYWQRIEDNFFTACRGLLSQHHTYIDFSKSIGM